MLEDPRFTRLGWGSGDEANSDDGADDGAHSGKQIEDRNIETKEQAPPERRNVDDGERTAGVDPARIVDEERARTDEPAVADDDAESVHKDVPYAAVDATDRSRDPVANPESSPDTSEGPSNDDHHNDSIDDDVSKGRETADRWDLFSADAEVNGEIVRARFDRWNPEQFTMSRPPKPDAIELNTPPPDEDPLDVDVQRAEDGRNAVLYVANHKDSKPWLEPVVDCEPVVQSVYVSIDQGGGHGHIRHGAMGTDEMQARRVAYNEDPAQLDPGKRALGIDGLDPTKPHYCGRDATRIHDATAFAAAYLGATEHPDVRAVLTARWDENFKPLLIPIPIADLLGPDGHRFCSGFALKDWPESKKQRKQWLQARDSGSDLGSVKEPEVEQIPTFEGGEIAVTFKRNLGGTGYEIGTIFPRLSRDL
ncbi:hypothetical protein OG394_29480 [Kribbella sp. NBC_01245]|uniref:hypothetical protein n=1 Tax=Kribbella sp. NBC_01245 TaxID=2903578 RepID=UPI002E2AE550|nr:hypothetical protein [Kribbella sp. NBC_01245]